MSLLRVVYVLGAVLSFLMLTSPAEANGDRHRASLEGFQEVPAVITGASGTLKVKIAPDDASFEFVLTYEGIEGGSVTQSHIHVGQLTANGGIVVFLCTNLAPPANVPTPPACPTPGGTVTGTRTAADVVAQLSQGVSAGDFAAVLTAIRAGTAYGNVHSTVSPSGEIRGQISRKHHHHGNDDD